MLRLNFVLSAGLILFGANSLVAQETSAPPKAPAIVNGGIINGKAKNLIQPTYPEAARAARVSGVVKVKVTIDENGNVTSASAIEGHPLLKITSVDAALQSKFTPTIMNGAPVEVTGVIVYNFAVQEPKLLWLTAAGNLIFVKKMPWNEPIRRNLENIASFLSKQFPNEQTQIKELAKSNGSNKIETIDSVLNSLESKLPAGDAWQIRIGKVLAEIAFDVSKQIADSKADIDETKLRDNLRELGNLVYSAPTEVSPESVAVLKRLTDYANQSSLKDSDKLVGLIQTFTEFSKTVSPATYK